MSTVVFLQFQCCGLTDYKDWEKNIYFNCSNANPSMEKCSVPWSCCKHENETVSMLERFR